MKTRIIINEMGTYKVQYKKFLFWEDWNIWPIDNLEEAKQKEKDIYVWEEKVKKSKKWRVL